MRPRRSGPTSGTTRPTALEGNTLVRKHVEILLNEGRAAGNKELKDYLEVTAGLSCSLKA